MSDNKDFDAWVLGFTGRHSVDYLEDAKLITHAAMRFAFEAGQRSIMDRIESMALSKAPPEKPDRRATKQPRDPLPSPVWASCDNVRYGDLVELWDHKPKPRHSNSGEWISSKGYGYTCGRLFTSGSGNDTSQLPQGMAAEFLERLYDKLQSGDAVEVAAFYTSSGEIRWAVQWDTKTTLTDG